VSHLVNGDHFELFNNGNPISGPDEDAGTPDITFFGNTPYISWIDSKGSGGADKRGFVGHFDTLGNFVSDTPGGIRAIPPRGPLSLIDARVALSSSCTADPFSKDGTACTPGDVNAALHTFATAGAPQRLFAQADIGGPNCVLFKRCKVDVHVHGNRAEIDATLYQSHFVGIVVDRRTGRGFKHVGRVPLGDQHKGCLRLRWNLMVNGKHLHRPLPGHAAGARQEGQRARPEQAGHHPHPLVSQRTGCPGRRAPLALCPHAELVLSTFDQGSRRLAGQQWLTPLAQ
jgi:hypothetical protein